VEDWPAGHCEHDEAPDVIEYVPAAHGAQLADPAPENEPAAHALQPVDPASEYDPAAQV